MTNTMEVAATISTRLFCLSIELRTKDSSSSIPPWWLPLLPALLAFLLHATVIRPLAVVAARHCCVKLEESRRSCSCSTWLRRVLSKVTDRVLRILLSEQTSLWLLYLVAPHLFDINVRLKVEVRTIRAMLHQLLNDTPRLLLRLVTGLLRGVSTASTDEDAAAAAASDRRRQPPAVREDGPRRSARHRRPSVRVAGPEWDKQLRG